MGWITKDEDTYWMPDEIPEKTEEYNNTQINKQYLTKFDEERMHPGWHYDNGAFVDDEYLFINEGWKLIVDDRPELPISEFARYERNPRSLWEEVDERTLKVTYKRYEFTQKEIEGTYADRWGFIRSHRDALLYQSDFAHIRALEQNLTVSEEYISYRQQLRDFPSSLTDEDVLNINVNDPESWNFPKPPEKIFEE